MDGGSLGLVGVFAVGSKPSGGFYLSLSISSTSLTIAVLRILEARGGPDPLPTPNPWIIASISGHYPSFDAPYAIFGKRANSCIVSNVLCDTCPWIPTH